MHCMQSLHAACCSIAWHAKLACYTALHVKLHCILALNCKLHDACCNASWKIRARSIKSVKLHWLTKNAAYVSLYALPHFVTLRFWICIRHRSINQINNISQTHWIISLSPHCLVTVAFGSYQFLSPKVKWDFCTLACFVSIISLNALSLSCLIKMQNP
jgi:hypothetical protein